MAVLDGAKDVEQSRWIGAHSCTANAVYAEDISFDFNTYAAGSSVMDGRSGGRWVLRYNTLKNIKFWFS